MTARTDPAEPRRSTEVADIDALERRAYLLGGSIDYPDGDGWALLTTPHGSRYHARWTGKEVAS